MIILDAAEEMFAELGYSAARIDGIAKASGYNKSMIYQYFGDKLGLYTEVIKRADQISEQATGSTITDFMKNDNLVKDPIVFRLFLEKITKEIYEFLLEHPRHLKILFWEAAEDWKTWNQITYRPDDITQLYELAAAAKKNGIIRQDFDPAMFPILILNMTTATIQAFSRYGNVLGKLDSPQIREQTIEQISKFIIHGVMEPSLL
ncbi:TetR/AcrR family transcriptional regulator [Paenibacillus monticola]|uniref:TetR family transcriptional regulator n=1 Tax=Paenibacillus monticola TaxID=2666075 RepID=A0A7X2H737_9BACL|nr:TetR family transcriptional regulator [Paenibacillus monticola]